MFVIPGTPGIPEISTFIENLKVESSPDSQAEEESDGQPREEGRKRRSCSPGAGNSHAHTRTLSYTTGTPQIKSWDVDYLDRQSRFRAANGDVARARPSRDLVNFCPLFSSSFLHRLPKIAARFVALIEQRICYLSLRPFSLSLTDSSPPPTNAHGIRRPTCLPARLHTQVTNSGGEFLPTLRQEIGSPTRREESSSTIYLHRKLVLDFVPSKLVVPNERRSKK